MAYRKHANSRSIPTPLVKIGPDLQIASCTEFVSLHGCQAKLYDDDHHATQFENFSSIRPAKTHSFYILERGERRNEGNSDIDYANSKFRQVVYHVFPYSHLDAEGTHWVKNIGGLLYDSLTTAVCNSDRQVPFSTRPVSMLTQTALRL